MRLFLSIVVVLSLVTSGFGVYCVVRNHAKVASLSATTTGVVLAKHLERRRSGGINRRGRNIRNPLRDELRNRKRKLAWEPQVKYRYKAHGQSLTSDRVFPPALGGGNYLGRLEAKAMLERFQVGQETQVWFNPADPLESCLIRRPTLAAYALVLLPLGIGFFASALIAARSHGEDAGVRRGPIFVIGALWHTAGLLSASHYFSLARTDYAGMALALFGIYTLLGMIPVAAGLGSTPLARRVKGSIGCALAGTLLGSVIGFAVGWVASTFFSARATFVLTCWGYGTVVTAALFALLGLLGRWQESTAPDVPSGSRAETS